MSKQVTFDSTNSSALYSGTHNKPTSTGIWPLRETSIRYASSAPTIGGLLHGIKVHVDYTSQEFALAISRIYSDMLAQQEPLGAAFEAVWDDNVADLYQS